MDIQSLTVSGPLVPETMTNAVQIAGFSFDWLLSAGLGIAIVMFVVKEVWEAFKRKRDNNRKMLVYKRVLRNECSRLYDFIRYLEVICETVRHASGAYDVATEPSGRQIIRLYDELGKLDNAAPLLKITTPTVEN